MEKHFYDDIEENGSYHGKILHGIYSQSLNQYISENISRFKAFDQALTPAIPYLAAWQEKENAMWYEFVGKGFIDLLGCTVSEAAETFRKSILVRRVYNYPEKEKDTITTQTLKKIELSDSRKGLRQEGEEKGVTEAVYKILLSNGSIAWLKDQATVKAFDQDKIYISSGFLTIITKEMEAEEKLRKTQEKLKENTRALESARKKQEENAVRLSNAIKQMKSAKKEAEKANKAKSEFLAVISHEIRNPMNGIIGTCDLIMADEPSHQQNEYMGIIKNSAVSLLGLVNDILDFSKIEAGKLDFQEISFDLRKVVEDMSDIILELASKKDLELVVDIDPDVPQQLVSDPMRLRQVLINLAFNALKFTEHGEIIIRVELSRLEKSHAELLFYVKDTGIGIAPEHLENLFDSFTQVNDSVSREYGGTGLGLAICKQIIEMMGGRIWVESTSGEGSTFYFKAYFKLDKKQDKERFNVKETFHQCKVLLAEEKKSSQRALKNVLLFWGFKITPCSSASQAIETINQEKPGEPFDLIIMDMELADLKKPRVFNEVQVMAASFPGFIATGKNGDGAKRASDIGIGKFLSKPVKHSFLLEAVNQVLGYSEDRDQIKDETAFSGEVFSDTCILLVEDSASNRKIESEMLQTAGIEVDTAENGIEAVEKIKNYSYAAVVMDMQMPSMDGIEASRIIRRQFSSDKLPIIAMSGHSRLAKWEECVKAGINDYIVKPVSKNELFKVLKKQLTFSTRVPLSVPAKQQRLEIQKKEIQKDNLPGLDIREGIDRLGGDKQVFANILKDFCNDYACLEETFEQYVSKKDFNAAATLAHSIKGSAGNISAVTLFEKAKVLEQACWDQQQDGIIKLIKPVQSAYNQVCDSAEKFFSSLEKTKKEEKQKKPDTENSVSSDDLMTRLYSLMESLDKFDPVFSKPLAMEIKESLNDQTDEKQMNDIVHNVQNYQFDSAQKILESLIKTIKKRG